MKKLILFIFMATGLITFSCKDDDENSERFKLLTGTIWVSDSLLINGMDASGAGGLLQDFVGTAKFNKDGTGQFGNYTGEWDFVYNETQLKIDSDSLDFPITAEIKELTESSLKITTGIPGPVPFNVRMTFKAQ